MDDEVLLLDGQEAIAAIVAHALGKARIVGLELQIGPIERDELGEIVQRQHAVEHEDLVLGRRRVPRRRSARSVFRHVGGDLEPDHRAAAAALQRGLEQAHEIFGLFLDFEIAVANDAENALPFQLIAGEQLLRVDGDQRLRAA